MPRDDNNPASESGPAESDGLHAADNAALSESPAENRTFWQSARLYLLRAAAVFGAILLILSMLTGGAASYTSRSEFCNSCHIMDPYYASWQRSSHHDVKCVKCHFPPGAMEKVRGKLLGLVQLTKYITKSAGPRPEADVPDASCTRCHDPRLLSGRVEFHGVPFDHRVHLADLGNGKTLRCTSCHNQDDLDVHISVSTTVCFTCHFKGQAFNDGLGACTRCHEIPQESFQLGGGVEFSHDLAFDRGVDCASCHGDLVRGDGAVPSERCTVCHNRTSDLARIDDSEFLHHEHLVEHKVECLSCHLEIQHSLQTDAIHHAVSDCNSCHPNQHVEQVRMLRGAETDDGLSSQSGMTGARLTCLSCHENKGVSQSGSVVWKASIASCANCHEESAPGRLEQYFDRLQESLLQLDRTIASARERASADAASPASAEMTSRLDAVEQDLEFIRVGNGIHNVHFATSLLRELIDDVTQISNELGMAAPNIPLPQESELFQ